MTSYAWNMLQNWFFCNFSKNSEKTAYLQTNVCRNPPQWWRCRYERRKKGQIDFQKFFGSAKVALGCKATNVDFSGFCTFMQVKIEIWMKKQHLLPKNSTFVKNQQQWCYFMLHIICSIRTVRKPSRCFAQFFDSCFW